MTVIDADGHVTETHEPIARYLDEPFGAGPLTSSLYPWDGWDRRLLDTFNDLAGTSEAWLQALDKGGMERAVLYPTLGLFMSFLKDRQWAVALCRAYNTFLHESSSRRATACKRSRCCRCKCPRPAPPSCAGPCASWGSAAPCCRPTAVTCSATARFDAVYEEAQRLDTMLGIHASGSHLGGAGVDLFPAFIQAHTCSHAFGQMRQLTSIVLEGIPERFPDVRIAFLEAGCGWAPYWMERMDDEYAKRAAEAPVLKKKPSEYVRSGKIYFSCEADEWLLPQAVKLIGENQIVYASDFPHWDHSWPASIDEIRQRGDLNDGQKQKILADNARRLYRL